MDIPEALNKTNPAPPATHRKRHEHSTGREWSWDGNEGWLRTEPLPEQPRTWDAFIADAIGEHLVDEVEVVGDVNVRGWDGLKSEIDPESGQRVSNVVRLHYYSIRIRRRTPPDSLDLPSLFTLARRARRKPRERPERPRRGTLVAYADPQTGKVASRGGTPELIERVNASLKLLEDYCDEMRSDVAYLFDLGDAIEGFENTDSQAFTNDLSLPRQVEVASDILWEFTDLLAKRHDEVIVAGVGSNHCRWRRGKGALGLPGDDWGVSMLRQLSKALSRNPAYEHVSVVWPGDHEETLALDVCGTIVGLAHGHQVSRPELIPAWWGKQVHGGQPLAQASILLTGHFHSFRTESTGRDPWTKREKRWFQAPTLDNGSDWYRYVAGNDSDPGLLVMTVDETGWSNMRVLRP